MATDQLSISLAALADPTRRAIIARLAKGDATVSELAEPFDMSLPSVSKHLSVLERAGLISKARSGQQRWCKLSAAPLRDVHEWADLYRTFWEEGLMKLGAHLDERNRNERD